jgi:hypothetical protein
MINYADYNLTMIAITPSGYAFVYWRWCKLIPVYDHEADYGRGKKHWFEYLGKYSKEDCRKMYPHVPVLQADDARISHFKKERLKELEELFLVI